MYEESVKGYWHIYSDGKKADIPFSSDGDKIYAMNSVAICAFSSGMEVLCLEVNDTHLHAVLRGDRPQEFNAKLKRRITTRENSKESFRGGFFLAADSIGTRDELLVKIIYTFRNCLDFFKGAPWEYRWGVGNLFFAKRQQEGRQLDQLSRREREKILGCTLSLPSFWRISIDGLILPSSYINAERVERLFGTVRTFLAFLHVRKDDELRIKQQCSSNYLQQRSIQDMREHANRLSNTKLGKPLGNLCLEERLNIAGRMLRGGSASRSESFAKALYLKKEDIDRLL